MKKLLILLALVLAFVKLQGTEETRPEQESKFQIVHSWDSETEIVQTENVTFSGEVFAQLIYYADGYVEVMHDYLNIRNIPLRKKYLIHRNINKDSIELYDNNSFKDFQLFNAYLYSIGDKQLSLKEYRDQILTPLRAFESQVKKAKVVPMPIEKAKSTTVTNNRQLGIKTITLIIVFAFATFVIVAFTSAVLKYSKSKKECRGPTRA